MRQSRASEFTCAKNDTLREYLDMGCQSLSSVRTTVEEQPLARVGEDGGSTDRLGLDVKVPFRFRMLNRVRRASKWNAIWPKESQPKQDKENIYIKGKSSMRNWS